MKFKIGDEVRCMDNVNVENHLTVGLYYEVESIYNLNQEFCIGVLDNNGKYTVFYADRFELATEQTPTATNFTQEDYDEMQDRIELLESLLVDANNRIASLESSLGASNRLIQKFSRLTYLVLDNIYVADLIDAKWGDDIVDKVCDYLLHQCRK